MTKKSTPLTVAALRKKPGRHRIDRGLYLHVRGNSALWTYRYMANGRAHEISLGNADVVTLADARRAVEHQHLMRHEGKDPISERRRASKSATFRAVALELIEAKRPSWRNKKHAQQWTNTLTTYAFPVIGELHVQDVTTDLVLQVLRPIWVKKHETATRLRQRIEAVLDAAAAQGLRSESNPARWKGHLDKLLAAIPKADRVQHHPAVPWRELPAFMAQLRLHNGTAARALEFIIHTAVRSGEAINATWSEFDLDSAVWTIPRTRMKAKREHRVPLSRATMTLLQSLPRFEDNPHVFAGRDDKPLSDMALAMLLRRMGRSETVHGFRSTFRDWISETGNFSSEIAEMALAHTIKNQAEAAYRRGDLLEKRRVMMEAWSAYCRGELNGEASA